MVPGRSAPPDADPLDLAAEILGLLSGGAASVLVHGEGAWAWPVLRWASVRGLDVRIGLEDTLVDASGEPAVDNAALVHEALRPAAR
jgi:beta-keto acid cleavage enzyme